MAWLCIVPRISATPLHNKKQAVPPPKPLVAPPPPKPTVFVAPPKPKTVVFDAPPNPTPPPPKIFYIAPKVVSITKAPELATGGIATALTLMIGGLLVIRGRKGPPSA